MRISCSNYTKSTVSCLNFSVTNSRITRETKQTFPVDSTSMRNKFNGNCNWIIIESNKTAYHITKDLCYEYQSDKRFHRIEERKKNVFPIHKTKQKRTSFPYEWEYMLFLFFWCRNEMSSDWKCWIMELSIEASEKKIQQQ